MCVRSMYASEAVTWEKAIDFLRNRAGEAFAHGRDDEAKVLRAMAEEWKNFPAHARKLQKEHEEEYGIDA